MPEEATAPPADTTEGAAPSSADTAEAQQERPDPNAWIRQSREGLLYSRPLDTAAKSKGEWDEANAELRRFRSGRNGTEETPRKNEPDREQPEGEQEPPSSKVDDDQEFQRRVQAEVDRREALRAQRQRQQQERELRRTNPQEYAKLKEQEESQNTQAGALSQAMIALSRQFDDATVTPLVQALKEDAREGVLKDTGHGLPGRKEIVTRAIKALQKSSYDEGYAKGKSEAERSLRRPSSSLRKELLAELRAGEEEPDLAPGNGSANGATDVDMNDWMRSALGRRVRSRE